MHLRSGVGCQTSVTASTTRLENASSVPENISGEYWKVQSVCGLLGRELADHARMRGRQLDDAVLVEAEHDAAHHRRRRVVQVHDRARAPRSDSKVRSISGSRACVSTWIVTSSGTQVLVDQLAHEVELGLRGRRESRPRSP